jgi:hypothetical protein
MIIFEEIRYHLVTGAPLVLRHVDRHLAIPAHRVSSSEQRLFFLKKIEKASHYLAWYRSGSCCAAADELDPNCFFRSS